MNQEILQRAAESGVGAYTARRSRNQRDVIRDVLLADAGDRAAESAGSGLSANWLMLKEKLGGRTAEFIDLLQHGGMTVAQLSAAARCDVRTAQKITQKMRSAGLLDLAGGVYSLRDI